MRHPLAALLLLVVCSGCSGQADDRLLDGDIVFQISDSPQSQAVQCATGSIWSHMGLVVVRDGEAMVLEAVGPVRMIPLADWMAAGVRGEIAVRRLRDRDGPRLEAVARRLLQDGHRFLGRPYDLTFEWSDDRLYCSELVWKIYQEELGLELAPLERFGDFDLECAAVKPIVAERWPAGPPLDMAVISPVAILDSPLLMDPLE
jgi:hypothetical protein